MVYIDILIKFLKTDYNIKYSYHVKLRITCKIIQRLHVLHQSNIDQNFECKKMYQISSYRLLIVINSDP